mgnify:CR=1 FL=1
MHTRVLTILVFFFLCVNIVYAQDVSISLVTPQGNSVANALITIQFAEQTQRGLLTSNEYTFSVDGEQTVLFIVDFLETPAKDYFGQEKFGGEIGTTRSVLIFPIGHLQGAVIDGQGNLVNDAELRFDCQHGFSIMYPESSDIVGSFSVPNMPVGMCHITARHGRQVGSADVAVGQGSIAAVEILLIREVGRSVWIYLVSGLVVIGGLGGISFYVWNSKKGQPEKHHSPVLIHRESDTASQVINSHADAIMQTLTEKERIVVEYLMHHEESSQATIRHMCKIPRTSLTRLFQNLERKKIVEVEKIGKLVKVRLTHFFLGKN